jgi:hypothetical protein
LTSTLELGLSFREYIKSAKEGSDREHSLHRIIHEKRSFPASLLNATLQHFTRVGDLVLDPLAGFGANSLEIIRSRREIIALDPDPLNIAVTKAKLNPIDIAETALALQSLPVNRLVRLDTFKEHFSAFYHIDTYRELINLRHALSGTVPGADGERSSVFLRAVTLGLLHGPQLSFFSGNTSQFESFSMSAQEEINRQNGVTPPYRAVTPRVLRKVAYLSRDLTPRSYTAQRSRVLLNKGGRGFSQVDTGMIDFASCIAPSTVPVNRWLERWFLSDSNFPDSDLTRSNDFSILQVEELLFELSRVLKNGSYFVVWFDSDSSDFIESLTTVIRKSTPSHSSAHSSAHSLPWWNIVDSFRCREVGAVVLRKQGERSRN